MSLVRHALSSNFQISMSNPTVQSERLPRTSTFEDSLRSLQQAFSYSVPSTNFFSTQSILSSAAQPRIAHARISQVVHSYSANRDQNGIFRNEENINRSNISNLVMTTEAESQTKRFYADLSPEQQKVLLKKADHYLC